MQMDEHSFTEGAAYLLNDGAGVYEAPARGSGQGGALGRLGSRGAAPRMRIGGPLLLWRGVRLLCCIQAVCQWQ